MALPTDDQQWAEYARLVLKGIENSEKFANESTKAFTTLKERIARLEVYIKLLVAITVPLIIDAIKGYIE